MDLLKSMLRKFIRRSNSAPNRKVKPFRKPVKMFLSWVLGFSLFTACVGFLIAAPVAFLLSIFSQFPSVDQFVNSNCFITEMFKVSFCKDSPRYITNKNIPHFFKRALLASEDGSFYRHHGFDFDALKISYEKNLKEGRFKSGGSTLTQQLAKNLFLSQEKSIGRKAKEVLLTLQLEQKLTKDQILETYVNVVEFAPNVFGLNSATAYYFKKNPKSLTPSESLFLTTLLPSPKKFVRSKASGQIGPFHGQQIKKIGRILWKQKALSDEQISLIYDRIDHGFWNYSEVDFEYQGLPNELQSPGEPSDSPVSEDEADEDQDSEMQDQLGPQKSPINPPDTLEGVGEGEDER